MIRFIVELGEVINNDPRVNDKMKVVYLEDYRVTLAELMIPAADISEQISLAGTEASGTGNMKFMINGAITLGTLDGANVEIHETVGDENMLLFGMTTPEAQSLSKNGYQSKLFYDNNPVIKHAIEEMRSGLNGFEFHDIANNLINVDPYMVLADFDSYSKVHQKSRKNCMPTNRNGSKWHLSILLEQVDLPQTEPFTNMHKIFGEQLRFRLENKKQPEKQQ